MISLAAPRSSPKAAMRPARMPTSHATVSLAVTTRPPRMIVSSFAMLVGPLPFRKCYSPGTDQERHTIVPFRVQNATCRAPPRLKRPSACLPILWAIPRPGLGVGVGTCAELASCIRRDAWHLKPDCPRNVQVPGSRISGNPHLVGRALQPQLEPPFFAIDGLCPRG